LVNLQQQFENRHAEKGSEPFIVHGVGTVQVPGPTKAIESTALLFEGRTVLAASSSVSASAHTPPRLQYPPDEH